MIFVFMSGISLLLDAGATFRACLIVLPFVGMLIDIAAIWFKGFVSSVFFWPHLYPAVVFSGWCSAMCRCEPCGKCGSSRGLENHDRIFMYYLKPYLQATTPAVFRVPLAQQGDVFCQQIGHAGLALPLIMGVILYFAD